MAHTEVKTLDVTAGIPDDNALKIGHGCETATGGVNPVIAQSVLFPQADLTGVLQGGSLVGQVDNIQDKSIFTIQAEKTTATGGVFGFIGPER